MKFGIKEFWERSSVPTSRSAKTLPLDKPFYISFIKDGQFYAAIFNNSVPYERFYKNGLPCNKWIDRGDALPDNVCTYEEGCMHTEDFMFKDTLKNGKIYLANSLRYHCKTRFAK